MLVFPAARVLAVEACIPLAGISAAYIWRWMDAYEKHQTQNTNGATIPDSLYIFSALLRAFRITLMSIAASDLTARPSPKVGRRYMVAAK